MNGREEDLEFKRIRKRQIERRKRKRRILIMKLTAFSLLAIALIASCVLTVNAVGRHLSERKQRIAESEAAVEAAAQAEIAESEAAEKEWETELPDIRSIYGIYVKDNGWSSYFADDSYCMAPVGNYVTAFRASLQGQPADLSGTICYSVNKSGSGWLDWTEDSQTAGNTEDSYQLESIKIELTGKLKQYYDVLYSVLQNGGWTDWVQNGEEAGVSGAGLHVDGVRVSVAKKAEGQISYAGNIDPNKPMVALTYDDGPNAKVTPQILSTLEEHGARATFFMVGRMAEKNKGIVKQMVEQGSEPGNHTYDHTLMTKTSADEYVAQLARTNQVVSDASGISPILMRPCGGERSEIGMTIVGATAMPAIMWSVDTLDWKTRNAQSTIDAVLSKVQDGDIILMHDLYETTAEARRTIIPELLNRGYQLVTVSELASYRGGMVPGGVYSKFRPAK